MEEKELEDEGSTVSSFDELLTCDSEVVTSIGVDCVRSEDLQE